MRPALALLLALALLSGCSRGFDPAATEAQARSLLAQGKPGEARILLKNSLARNPSFTQARVLLAAIAMDDGNAVAARDELSVADAAALATAEAVALRTRVALALDEVDQAATIMREQGDAVAEPERSMLRAATALAQGSVADALTLLRGQQREHPADPRLVLAIADALGSMGGLTQAIDELDAYLESGPPARADALRARGELNLRQGAPERAAEDFRAALRVAHPAWPRVSRLTTELMLGDALLASGDLAAAKQQIQQIDVNWPGMHGTELLRAQVSLLEGRPGEAAARMGPLAAANPDNVRLQYLLIDALVKSGNIARATELLERQVKADPESPTPRQVLADLYMQQGRPDRVIELLRDLPTEDVVDKDESDEMLESAREARAAARAKITELTAKLKQTPGDPRLLAELATAQTANGDPASALVTLGAMPQKGWVPEAAAARMSALVAMNNEFEANRLVDRLLDPAAQVDAAVLLAAADVAYRARQNANVSRLLDRAARLLPGDADVQMRRASLAFDASRYDEAERLLRPLVSATAPNLAAQVALARVLEARGNLDQARAVLGTAIGESPEEHEPALRLASLELRANRLAEASAVLDRMIAAAPDAEAANAAGMLMVDENRFEDARRRFRQAVDREPDDARFWYNLGQSQLALSDPAAASESFTRAAALDPGSLPLSVAAVRLAIEQHNPAAARRSVDALAGVLPDDAVTLLLLGEVAMAEGRPAQAEDAFARSFLARPGSQAATGEYHARVALGSPRAVEPLRSWLAREPEDTEARHLLADYYLSRNQDDAAREQLEVLVAQAPNDVVALNNLAWLLRDVDGQRAERLAVQANAIAPDNPAIADTLGTVLLGNGKFVEALAMLEIAAGELPDDESVQAHYAEALRRVEESR